MDCFDKTAGIVSVYQNSARESLLMCSLNEVFINEVLIE